MVEFARQMSLLDQNLFTEITPAELLNKAWTKRGGETQAPALLAMIGHFNTVRSLFLPCI